MNQQEIGKKIKSLRTKLHLTQEEFGEKIGISQEVISYWEGGHRKIRAEDILKVAEVFQCSLDDFFKRDHSPKKEKGDMKRPKCKVS